MIKIVTIGMNHETAPVEMRECIAREPSNCDRALAFMRESEYIREGLFLSTCNRVEALYTTDDPDRAGAAVISMLARLGDMPEEKFLPNLYVFGDAEAVRHVFRVASSLDSMIIGEPQILGQIKDAYSLAAIKEKTSGVIINRLMHKAFHVAKRIRTETGISEAAVSVSYAAVELAKKIFYDLENKTILLVGAGEMAELAAQHLMAHGIKNLVVANRSFDRAVNLAERFNGKAILFDEINEQLVTADIIIASTGAPGYVITHDEVKKYLRKRRSRPLFFVDIAVPRDVEPRVNGLGNVYVYDIDDLKGVVEENAVQRQREAVRAERIITEEVLKFEKWMKTLDVVPTIKSLKEKVEGIRKAEISKSMHGLGDLSPSQVQALENLTLSLANKIINDPILTLKRKAGRSSRDTFLDATRKLFELDQDDNKERSS
ncbi:MAG: glutamyl-tRNA reductase [Deltaproteobacteria bacterium]|nr:glutamyl-tRNA reductase [Deltaproteobacteria bacterium]